MILYIKYMVSHRCKIMVKQAFADLGLHTAEISLGEVALHETITDNQLELLRTALHGMDLELMDDKKAILIAKIKAVIVNMVHYTDEVPQLNFSAYLADSLNYDYTYMANLFSVTTGTTIEQFIICHKIERAKELIMYGELSLTDIADKLHYSSVSHLSNQFKKVTGLTPSFFRTLKRKKRTELEDVCE